MSMFNGKRPTSPPVLPLSGSSPSAPRSFRLPTRKISYTLKQKASRHAKMLFVFSVALFVFGIYTYTRTPLSPFAFSSATNAGKLHLYTRETYSGVDSNGLSLLSELENELSEEDDALWKLAVVDEPGELSYDQQEAARKQKALSVKKNLANAEIQHGLSSLIWWLAEGGMFPTQFDIPEQSELMKFKGDDFEKWLDGIDKGESGDTIFQEGWEDYAKQQYRTTVFSKSYCPFSKKAKAVLAEYPLSPAPYVIELDRRSDMSVLQTLLHRLTGRRTVPNVLFDFKPAGGADEILLMQTEGRLQKLFEEMDVVPRKSRRRGGQARQDVLNLEAAVKAVHRQADQDHQLGEFEVEKESADNEEDGFYG